MKRRGFLGGIMGAVAVTPEKALKAAGVNVPADGYYSGGIFSAGQSSQPILGGSLGVDGSARPWWSIEQAKLNALKLLNPEWFERKRRRNAHYVAFLDPDIASFRSVSASAKMNMQRERNYANGIKSEIENLDILAAENLFKV